MAFIEQEANEKAEEIDAKAEEEFNIEKGRLVQQQRIKIMEYYEKKEKQVELQKKIQSSNMLNQARLKVLKVREDHVRSVLDEARRRLGAVTQDASRYSQILQSLITQGLFQIMEANIMIRGRKQDAQLIQNVLPASVEQYKRETGKDVVVTLDTESYLSTDSTGGIEIFALQGRIRVRTMPTMMTQIWTSIFTFAGRQHTRITSRVDCSTAGSWNPYGSFRSQRQS